MLGRKIVAEKNPKLFATRLQHCLDETDAPANVRERAVILSKILDVPKHEAWALLEGREFPSPELIESIASEFEVDPKWLAGN